MPSQVGSAFAIETSVQRTAEQSLMESRAGNLLKRYLAQSECKYLEVSNLLLTRSCFPKLVVSQSGTRTAYHHSHQAASTQRQQAG